MIGHERAGALVGPFDRTAEQFRGVQDADIFRIDGRLHAERAADIAGQHADLVGRRAEDVFQHVLHAEHALAARMQRPLSVGLVEFADRRARLHRRDDETLVDQRKRDDMRGVLHRLGDLGAVAMLEVERDVAGDFVIELRRARLGGVARRDHGGQGLDVERDRFGGVLRLRDGFGDDAGDRIADEAHLVGAQRRARHIFDRRAVAALERQRTFEPAIGLQIGGGEHRQHAGHALGRGGVDAANDSMRLAGADHHRIGLVRLLEVVGIAAFAAHQNGVLFAGDRLADAEFGQRKGALRGSVIHFGDFSAWRGRVRSK